MRSPSPRRQTPRLRLLRLPTPSPQQVRRVLRIFPLYYSIIALSLLALPAFLPPDKAARFGEIAGDRIYYWCYLQNIPIARAGQPRHGILDVTWSLAIEEQFYFVWPLVVFIASPRTLKRVCGGLCVL